MIDPIVVRLMVAALGGLAVGLEREWSGHASGPYARFAGIRTFLLLGGLGGIAGWLAASGTMGVAITLVAGAAALIVSAYLSAARRGGRAIDGTTEVAALVVVGLGVVAGFGFLEIASGSTAIVVLALSEKERLRSAVARLASEEMRAATQFAVLALVIFPLLPSGTYGPLGGINPRALWAIVLLFSALNFAAYVARGIVGEARGYGITGMLGGMVSSTGVSFQFSRLSRDSGVSSAGLALGVVGACTVLLPRLLVISAVLNYRVAAALVPLFAVPFLVGVALVGFAFARRWDRSEVKAAAKGDESPLRLWSAIKMALAFQAALMAIAFVRQALGPSGVLASAAVLGLTDMDALTVSMNRLGTTPDIVRLSSRAMAVGVIANSILKLTLVVVLGSSAFRRLAGAGLALLTIASVATLWMLW